ncbi:unnamed protein product [Prorocentrum cordatum]|uniref:Uncharacterized protein n=1 Tax=Prorocentrum cordatum TaxID=2364126 RepID=A0ABN9VD78_9DINO|nr:unnamed protein product [Polarella glacialis]
MRLMYPEWSEKWAAAERALQLDLERASERLEAAGLPGSRAFGGPRDLHSAAIHGARDLGASALRSREFRSRTLGAAAEVEMEARVSSSSSAAAEPRRPAAAASA